MSTPGSIALILLIVQALICAIVLLAIAGGLVYAMRKLRMSAERAMPEAQAFTARVAAGTQTVCDKIADPLIRAHAATGKAQTVAASARSRIQARIQTFMSARRQQH